jgi:hypothetical protein
MEKAAEYRMHADECRRMAERTPNSEYKAALLTMAETWEKLAQQRTELLARKIRIAALAGIAPDKDGDR